MKIFWDTTFNRFVGSMRSALVYGVALAIVAGLDSTAITTLLAQDVVHQAAQTVGESRSALDAQPDGLIVCEGEEFQPAEDGWRAQHWGANYYAATFANSFLSRKAFLGAPAQCEEAAAVMQVRVPVAGRYLALVRYEAAYRFETQFRIRIEQNGRRVFDRLYGARDNVKVWAFRKKLQKEVGWSWGAVENVVWEGHDAFVNLRPGLAKITLIAGKQPEPAAKRNVDLVMLTTDVEQVKMRIEKENYLPLDGMLTQSGDVWLRVTNLGKEPLVFTGRKAPGGGNWQQHSPYWVHLRNWKTPSIEVPPGKTSGWVDVGGTMDSLNDGQWYWTGNQRYKAEFALREPQGKMTPIGVFSGDGNLDLAADADTRYSRRLRTLDQVLYDLLDYLKTQPKHGSTPKDTIIYANTFDALDDGKHAAAVKEFKQLFALSDTKAASANGRGYVDVRSVKTENLDGYCRQLERDRKGIAVVSLGDEIRLPTPRGEDASQGFRQWLKSKRVSLNDVDPSARGDWNKVTYNVDSSLKDSKPGLFYWSKRYQYHFGIQTIKQRTDILRRHFPNAGIGANYSPHYPQEHMFLGEVFKWVSVFRRDGMTLPWSEDYIWQVPVGTPQMNNINLDLFRAALRHHPDRKIIYYVMPHRPNNTPNQWRRLFFGALGHGMKIVNLFEFRPVHVAYTENHVDDPAMYAMILRSFREMGQFEDIVQNGQIRSAEAAMWFSETGDIWGDSLGSFAAAKRSLYTAIRHQQIPLDFVVEADATDGTLSKYKTLYLTDAHVSSAASAKIAAWVQAGGVLLATAGAGMFDELDRPNRVLRELLGVDQSSLTAPEDSRVTWIKQDLPFTRPIDTVAIPSPGLAIAKIPVISVRSNITLDGAVRQAAFADETPAITVNHTGKGRAIYLAFLPGLSYYLPAIPKRPVDRGATDNAMIHFLPTKFDDTVARLIASTAKDIITPVRSSHPLVETTVVQSKAGVAIALVNWTHRPIAELKLTVQIPTPTKKVSLASGNPVRIERGDRDVSYVFDLEVADALILR